MKNLLLPFGLFFVFFTKIAFCQDTFSIVAIDSVTGEVGSAGASCVDLFNTSFPNDDFLSVHVPGVGAINTQASYLTTNQNNATNRMLLGFPPDSIIAWLVANDAQGNPNVRQYGIVAFVGNSPQTAGYTGTSTFNYKNHLLGPNYAIQGNILLGQKVLDSMEARFLREDGDLACKLMAALQGAKMLGADTRCTNNGTSSLFAFVKVSSPGDSLGFPSFKLSVRTHNGDQIEPIDSLQTLFDQVTSCGISGIENVKNNMQIQVFPNPAKDEITLKMNDELICKNSWIDIFSLSGNKVLTEPILNSIQKVSVSKLQKGIYFYQVKFDNKALKKGKIVIE